MTDGRSTLIVARPNGAAAALMPALVAAAERAEMCFLEFFTVNIRNPHTR